MVELQSLRAVLEDNEDENTWRNKEKIDIFKNRYSRHFSNFSNGNKTFY
jgi:hypothetical protein